MVRQSTVPDASLSFRRRCRIHAGDERLELALGGGDDQDWCGVGHGPHGRLTGRIFAFFFLSWQAFRPKIPRKSSGDLTTGYPGFRSRHWDTGDRLSCEEREGDAQNLAPFQWG